MDNSKPYKNYGPFYAAVIIMSWLSVHIYSLFLHDLNQAIGLSVSLILLQSWLYTGLFIIAHDTMHGSLFRDPRANAITGRIILFVYAGFNWGKMRAAHHDHHKYSGTDKDPDFNPKNPRRFWAWYSKFFWQYFGLKQVAILAGFTMIYIALGAPYENTIIMWAVPAILSSVQLFYFGTYLTHRHDTEFADHHNARSNDYPLWLSLLSCFHFGYHHEHHLYPHEPWWRLPKRKFL